MSQDEAQQFYTGVVAEIYGPLRSEVPDPAPYAHFIRTSGEPALELGCGTGDPLLDLRADGLDVEGLDSSADMLARCRDEAGARNLEVVLHHQPIESMDLDRRYRSIFIAGPTFNLLTDDNTAQRALERIRVHLEAQGSALIPLFLPAETAPEHLGRAREHTTVDGVLMRVTSVSEARDESQRTQTTVLRYELVTDDETVVDDRPWTLHWHTQDGFRRLATDAGLDVRAVLTPGGKRASVNDEAFVFILTKPE